MSTKELILPKKTSKTKKTLLAIIGSVLIIPVFIFYGVFFERDEYIKRKALLKWIKVNGLPKIKNPRWESPKWCLGEYTITLQDDSTFYVDKGWELEICSFRSGFFDRYYYNKILKILIKARDNKESDKDA